jgi:two-component system, NarL family, sensor histidine kinase DevS
VARHANASKVDVTVAVEADRVVMRVTDDGVGPPANGGRSSGGNGLINMQARAAALGGDCTLTAGQGSGAVLTWSVPY